MPNGDGTGPAGNGPKTGRGLGTCPPTENAPNYPKQKPRRKPRNNPPKK